MNSTRSLKVLIIGEGSAGKTSLRSRYLNDSFQRSYISTIGADFVSKTIEVDIPIPTTSSSSPSSHKGKKAKETAAPANDGKRAKSRGEASTSAQSPTTPHDTTLSRDTVRVTLSLWDTAGQERFKSLGSAFYRGSDAVIIAFDLSKKGSLARTINWYNDFCRLGDIGFEEEGMNNRQRKKAREQKERFCWVAVGCKGDLLEQLSQGSGRSDGTGADEDWKGTSWTEARGWFDSMIPRLLPEGEVERIGYRDVDRDTKGEAAVPYTIGEQVPARPEDVLSRPNEVSSSSSNVINDSGRSNARPAGAGLDPGDSLSPRTKSLRTSSRQGGKSKSTNLRENRKSIRSIDVWQGNDRSSSSDTVDSSSTMMKTTNRRGRNRYDSTTSAGGAPSIYHSIRGSTFFGQSPDGSSTAASTSDKSTATVAHHYSKSVSARDRKQSNLSEVVTNEEEDGNESNTLSAVTNGSSSNGTIKGEKAKKAKDIEEQERARHSKESAEERKEDDEDDDAIIADGASIPTIPSGDPIPFPSSADYKDGVDDEEEEEEVPRRRGSRLGKTGLSKQRNSLLEEGEAGRRASVIAENTRQDDGRESMLGSNQEALDPRTTLYSARPSSISSTIKGAADSEGEGRLDDQEEDAGLFYRNRMMEQGFRLFFTSAKEGEGVEDVFKHIAKRVAMRWKLEEWEDQEDQTAKPRTAPPTDEEVEREMVKRAIKISSGKGTGSCCS
ncbi:hypothetical protein CBS101457_003711 [Exobasidium rhododendri]|nr:hypothetical protein CBS101457_003711 [Exobasidium rhododendri]